MFNTDLSGSAVMVVLLGVWHPGLSTVRMWLSRRLCLRSASSSLIVTPLKRPLLVLAVVVFTGVFTSGDKPWSIGEAKLPAPWTYLLPLPEGIGVTVLTDSPLAKVLLTVLDMLAWIVPIRSSAVITVKLDWMRCGVTHVVIYKLTPLNNVSLAGPAAAQVSRCKCLLGAKLVNCMIPNIRFHLEWEPNVRVHRMGRSKAKFSGGSAVDNYRKQLGTCCVFYKVGDVLKV